MSPLSDDQMEKLSSPIQNGPAHPLTDDEMENFAHKPSLGEKALGYAGTALKAIDSVTGAPTRAGIYAAQTGQNPVSAIVDQFGNMTDQAPTGADIARQAGVDHENINPDFKPLSKDMALANAMGGGGMGYGMYGAASQTPKDEVVGAGIDIAANPVNFVGPAARAIGKGAEALGSVSNAIKIAPKTNAAEIAAAAERLGFKATPGMLLDSHAVGGMESSLSQSPSIPGALVRSNIKPVANGLKAAAEDLVSGANTNTFDAGISASKGVISNLGEKVNNIKMSYEPFNQELPKMVPAFEDKAKLADQIAKIGQSHIDPNDVNGLVTGITNRIAGAKSLEDIEETRKILGDKITQAYSNSDRALVDTLSKIKDKLSDFRDDQFQTLAKQAYPGAGGSNIGKQMIGEYRAAMDQHHALMNDLKDVGPLFGIKANNPRDFIEAFSQIPPEQISKKLFQTNNFQAIQKVKEYFPEEFETIKNLQLQELRNSSLANPIDPHNSPVDPNKLISKINKLSPQVQSVLFGDKYQKVHDMQTVLGSFPNKVGPSGTPEGGMFSAPIHEQATGMVRYGAYKAMAAPIVRNQINSLAGVAPNLSRTLSNIPNAAGPGVSLINSAVQDGNEPKGYSGGGTVQSNPPPPPPPPTYIDPDKAKDVQASMRKAFHFANGGTIPGAPQVPVDSPQNDNTVIKATPGEVVLPLSVTKSPNAPQMAKEFMQNELSKNMVPLAQQQPQGPQTGPEKWAHDGFQSLKSHVNDQDRKFLEEHKSVLMLDPKAQNLIIAASSFKPGAKALDNIIKHLKNRIGGK